MSDGNTIKPKRFDWRSLLPSFGSPIHTPKIDRFDQRSELKRMGVVPETMGSTITTVLSESRLHRERAVRVPGRVLWFDPELARRMGFDVPPSNELTPELERQLLDKFSWRILGKDEDAAGREEISVLADRYGGTGTSAAGAVRAAFLPWLNACLKGFGATELSRITPHGEKRWADFQHSHGHISTRDVAAEAAWGIVGDNLFEMGSSQVLAMIDIGEHTLWGNGSTEHSVLEVRVGNQMRPAHVMYDSESGGAHSLQTFERMARASGILVENEGQISIDETMRKMLAQHALTAAEQFSFRVLHGAMSTGNMEFGGGQLDLTTMTAQDRTAPIETSENWRSRPFGQEQERRLGELKLMYDGLVKSIPKRDRESYEAGDLDVKDAFNEAYRHFLERELMERAGLKPEVAEAVQRWRPRIARTFSELIVKMSALANDGNRLVEKVLPDKIGVLDVFGLLGSYPAEHFRSSAPRDRIEREQAIDTVRELLDPTVLGGASRQSDLNSEIREQCGEFIDLYRNLMDAARELGRRHYGDDYAMQRSITSRARFQNEPMPLMYKATFIGESIDAVEHFRTTGDRRVFKELIDKRSAASLRNVEGLHRLGSRSRLPDGSYELQKRAIDGITYSLIASDNGDRTARLSIPLSHREPFQLHSLPGGPWLHRDQIVDDSGGPSPLRYRYTIDDWKTFSEVGAKIVGNEIVFEIDLLPSDVGRLEGVFHCTGRGDFWLHDATPTGEANFRGWVFASPDAEELVKLASTM